MKSVYSAVRTGSLSKAGYASSLKVYHRQIHTSNRILHISALTSEVQNLSSNLFWFKADRLAAGLLQLGLSHGDRLGIWGPNSTEWYISRLAASRAGLIAVSIKLQAVIGSVTVI